MSESELIERIRYTSGEKDRLTLLQELEGHNGSWVFHYEMGEAYSLYCSWYLTRERNPELRQKFMELSIKELECAFNKSEGNLPDESPMIIHAYGSTKQYKPDRCDIACELGRILTEDPRVKNHQKAMDYFGWAANNSKSNYYPGFIAFARLLMQFFEFPKAERILMEAKIRASKESMFKKRGIPPAIDRQLGAVYDRWAKHEKRSGRLERAAELLQKRDSL